MLQFSTPAVGDVVAATSATPASAAVHSSTSAAAEDHEVYYEQQPVSATADAATINAQWYTVAPVLIAQLHNKNNISKPMYFFSFSAAARWLTIFAKLISWTLCMQCLVKSISYWNQHLRSERCVCATKIESSPGRSCSEIQAIGRCQWRIFKFWASLQDFENGPPTA